MSTTEEKLDNLIASVASLNDTQRALNESQRSSQASLDQRFRKLEEDFAKAQEDFTRAQEDATERAIKRAKRERPLEFKNKGHREQFSFNSEVADHVDAAARKLQKLTPAGEKERKVIEEALEELKEGTDVIAERQKHIRIADQSPNHWRTVEAYKKALLTGSEEEDAAEKLAEQDALQEKQRASITAKPKMPLAVTPFPPVPPQWPVPPPNGPPPPPLMSTRPMIGPCFQCGMMGHLKRHCPRRTGQQYPFQNEIINAQCNSINIVGCMCRLNSSDTKVAVSKNANVCGEPNRLVKIRDNGYPAASSPVECDIQTTSTGSGAQVPATIVRHKGGSSGSAGAQVNVGQVKCSVCPFVPSKGVDELSQYDEIPEEALELGLQGVDSGSAGHAESQRPQSTAQIDDSGMGKTDPADQGLPVTYWELEQGDTQVTRVKGRLKANITFWEGTLSPAPWIISCIREGYKLPLRMPPNRFSKPNQKSALENREFVTQALAELEQNDCIVRVTEQPYICNPLSVATNSQGKLHLVLNLRYLNQFLWIDKFKYEDLRTAMQLFQKGDYLFAFDLKSGYHHIDIFEPHRKFLGLQWEVKGRQQFYMFTVLPFGLATQHAMPLRKF